MNLYKLKPFIQPIGYFLLVTISMTSIHWFFMKLYTHICCQTTFYGFLANFMNLGSPICQLLNSIQYTISESYIKIWTTSIIAVTAWIGKNSLKFIK